MNYGKHNHNMIARLINKRLVKSDDVFAYFYPQYNDWFIVSRYIDRYGWIWGYRINQNNNPGYDNIIGTFIYFNLERRDDNYPTEFIRFVAEPKDWHKFQRRLNEITLVVKTPKIRAEHTIAVASKVQMIEKRMLKND